MRSVDCRRGRFSGRRTGRWDLGGAGGAGRALVNDELTDEGVLDSGCGRVAW